MSPQAPHIDDLRDTLHKSSNQIAVIGAGISGLMAAIRLRHAGYDVTIFDKNDGVLTETSALASEAHSGLEYPNDARSAKDCLTSLIEFVRCLPEEVFAGKGRTVFFVANESDAEYTPKMREQMRILQEAYAQACKIDPAKQVLGDPADAFSEHDVSEFPQMTGVKSAFLSPQRGFNILHLATILKRHAEIIGIKFKLEHDIQDILPTSNQQFKIKGQKANGTNFVTDEFSQVIIAAYFRGFELAKRVNPQYDPGLQRSNYREISIAKLSTDALVHTTLSPSSNITGPATCFTTWGSNGGMFSPIGDNRAIIYHPSTESGHIAHITTANKDDIPVPPIWAQETRRSLPSSARSKHALKSLQDGIYSKLLHAAEIDQTYRKIAISSETDNEQRPNRGPQEVVPGCQDLSLTSKATSSVLNATTAAKNCLEHSLKQNQISPEEYSSRLQKLQTTTVTYPEEYRNNPEAFVQDAKEQAHFMQLSPSIVKPYTAASNISQVPPPPHQSASSASPAPT